MVWKNYSSLIILTYVGVCLPLSFLGCGKASFPKDELLSSVKKMCRNEYHVDVLSKIEGSNLGTFIVLENIFDREEGLSKEASEHIGDILLAVSRISISTDAPLEFYTVVAADKGIPGVEAVFVRYVDDVKRYLLGSISREDFFQRLMIDVRFNPAMLAERTVLSFFSNLSTGNTRNLLANYLKKSSDSTEFSLAFLRMILEIKLKDNVHFEVLNIKTKPLPTEKALVYCKVKETYTVREGYTNEDFTFPSDSEQEYLFVVGASNYLPEIHEIIPLDYKDDEGQVKKRALPAEYAKYGHFQEWPKEDFLLDDTSLPQFLAGQMAQRIVRKVRELEDQEALKNKKEGKEPEKKPLDFRVESVKGHYIPQEEGQEPVPSFRLDFKISELEDPQTIPSNLYELAFTIVKDVIEKYKFNDFKEIRFSRTSSKEFKIIPKNALLS